MRIDSPGVAGLVEQATGGASRPTASAAPKAQSQAPARAVAQAQDDAEPVFVWHWTWTGACGLTAPGATPRSTVVLDWQWSCDAPAAGPATPVVPALPALPAGVVPGLGPHCRRRFPPASSRRRRSRCSAPTAPRPPRRPELGAARMTPSAAPARLDGLPAPRRRPSMVAAGVRGAVPALLASPPGSSAGRRRRCRATARARPPSRRAAPGPGADLAEIPLPPIALVTTSPAGSSAAGALFLLALALLGVAALSGPSGPRLRLRAATNRLGLARAAGSSAPARRRDSPHSSPGARPGPSSNQKEALMNRHILAWVASAALLGAAGAAPAMADDSGATQALGQSASNQQSASSDATSTQVNPSNQNISVRVLSPGDDGSVSQTNASQALSAAGNLNKTSQSASQTQGGGGGTQAAGQTADSKQSADADASSTQLHPSNQNIDVRVLSPGDNGSVQPDQRLAGRGAGRQREQDRADRRPDAGRRWRRRSFLDRTRQQAECRRRREVQAGRADQPEHRRPGPEPGRRRFGHQTNASEAAAVAGNANKTTQDASQNQGGSQPLLSIAARRAAMAARRAPRPSGRTHPTSRTPTPTRRRPRSTRATSTRPCAS